MNILVPLLMMDTGSKKRHMLGTDIVLVYETLIRKVYTNAA